MGRKVWESREYWEGRFSVGDTPWQLSCATPLLQMGLDTVSKLTATCSLGRKVLCPGAGRGADAVSLVRKGYEVTAVDWSDSAVAHMRTESEVSLGELAGNLKIYHADFFTLKPQHVDIVFEHTFYCAIDSSRRAEYVHAIAQWLDVGGILFGNFFVKTEEAIRKAEETGPPFFSSEEGLRQSFASKFKCLHLCPVLGDAPGRRGAFEWLGVFERL